MAAVLFSAFYTILSWTRQDNSFRAAVKLTPEHPIFGGHFPGRPITPGVCVLQIAEDLTGRATGERVAWEQVDSIKYLGIIDPRVTPEITFQINLTPGGERLRAQVVVTDTSGTALTKISGWLSQSEILQAQLQYVHL
jgi:3-hydroxyacyl-[acyl-carrier-protein] dehydratase